MDPKKTEFTSLREELINSDRTCIAILGVLISLTVGASTLYKNELWIYAGIIIQFIWIIGFCYFSQYRYGIRVIANYILCEIEEKNKDNYGWEKYRLGLSNINRIKIDAFWDPYTIETLTSFIFLLTVPVIYIFKWYFSFKYILIFTVSIILLLTGVAVILFGQSRYIEIKYLNEKHENDSGGRYIEKCRDNAKDDDKYKYDAFERMIISLCRIHDHLIIKLKK